MNPLLWAFISLQLAAPLPNISSWQTPGLDTGGPFRVSHFSPVNSVLPKVAHKKVDTYIYGYSCRWRRPDGQTLKCARLF